MASANVRLHSAAIIGGYRLLPTLISTFACYLLLRVIFDIYFNIYFNFCISSKSLISTLKCFLTAFTKV